MDSEKLPERLQEGNIFFTVMGQWVNESGKSLERYTVYNHMISYVFME